MDDYIGERVCNLTDVGVCLCSERNLSRVRISSISFSDAAEVCQCIVQCFFMCFSVFRSLYDFSWLQLNLSQL